MFLWHLQSEPPPSLTFTGRESRPVTKTKFVFVSVAMAEVYRLFNERSSTSTGRMEVGMTSQAKATDATMMRVVRRQSQRAAERKEGPVVTQ